MPLSRFGRHGLIWTAARTTKVVDTTSAVSGALAGRESQARAPEQVASAPASPPPDQPFGGRSRQPRVGA